MTAALELWLLNGVYAQYDGLFNGLKYWLCHIYTCHNTVELLLSANYEMYFVSNDSVLDAILPKSGCKMFPAPFSYYLSVSPHDRKMSMTAALELWLLNGVYWQYDGLFNGLKYWLCHIYTCHNTVELLFSANYAMYFVSNDSVLDAILPKFRHAAPIPKPVPKWSHEFQ